MTTLSIQTARVFALIAAMTMFASFASAGEKALMHCFAFTAIEDASEDDWKAFYKATDELPAKIDGLNKVWVGKLRRPLRQYGKNEETAKLRQYGACMELKDAAALAVYAKHPAHAEWAKVYAKVRVPGTTTYDILGQ